MMDMFYTESIQHVFFLQASCITCSDLYAGYSEYLVFDASYYQVTNIADIAQQMACSAQVFFQSGFNNCTDSDSYEVIASTFINEYNQRV